MSEDSKDEKHEFPRWEELYQQQQVESMPWFNPELDDDLGNALDELGLRGGSALTSVPDPALRRYTSPGWASP